MKTTDVKVGSKYLHEGQVVTVIKRNKGAFKKYVGFYPEAQYKQKTFTLDNGQRVKADKLQSIKEEESEIR